MTTQVISTTVTYVSKASFAGQVFFSVEDVIRPEKKLDHGFFMFFNKFVALLHQQVEGFSNLPMNLELKVLFNMMKGAKLTLSVTRYEEGEQINDEDVADEVTYYVEVLNVTLSKKGQQEMQEQFLLSSMAMYGLKNELISMLKAKAARMGGTIAPETPTDDAADDAKDAPADGDADGDADDDVPAWKKAATDVATLSPADKGRRTRWINAGNALI